MGVQLHQNLTKFLSSVVESFHESTTGLAVSRLRDPRLGPVTTDVTSVNVNQAAATATYTRGYSVTGTGGSISGTIRSVADVGEGLDFDYNTTWQVAFTGFGAQMPRSFRFMTDSTSVQFMLNTGAALIQFGFQVYVDDRPVSLSAYVPSSAAGGVAYHTIIFPTSKVRKIEIRTACYLGYLAVPKPYDIWKPTPRKGPRVLIITDSFGTTANVTLNAQNAMYYDIGPYIGTDDVWLEAMGGTGYGVHSSGGDGQTVPAGGSNRYIDRIENRTLLGKEWNLEGINPEIVLVHGGHNDKLKGRTNAQLIADKVTVHTRLRERLPQAKLVDTEGFITPGLITAVPTIAADYTAVRTAVQSQLAGVGVYHIDTISTKPWLRGLGSVAAPNADGENANIYITGTDTYHGTDAFHQYVRTRMGNKLRMVAQDSGALVNTLL